MTLGSQSRSLSSPAEGLRLRLLILDFDGVLWDSAGEVYEVAWRAYREMGGAVLDQPEDRERFMIERPWARTGLDFYLLMQRLELARSEGGGSPLDEATWSELRGGLGEDAARFLQHYYEIRCRFRDSDRQRWYSFQSPYAAVVDSVVRHVGRLTGVALATTKDTDSAAALLESTPLVGIPIYGREFSENKAEQVLAILERFAVEPSEAVFVDDLIENLGQVAPLGVPCALASWGYNTAEARSQAGPLGYPVLTQEEFGRLLEERTA